jgi:hypothetical protein
MNNSRRIALNWVMVECLAAEVWRDFPVEWHQGTMLEQLLHWYAARDLRFEWAGFWWSQPDGYLVYSPEGGVPPWHEGKKFGAWRHEREEWYVGEAAMAAFLGLDVRSSGLRMAPTSQAMRVIYKRFGSAPEASDWINRQVSRRVGPLFASSDSMGSSGSWPLIMAGRLVTDKYLEIPSIKQQLAGDKSWALHEKD